ncbi:MAG: GNAT family N-acetyltransferase, partial [Clostridia bacterium]|nr:GNAT family N-acetyltransferase [Clostridia bacterium]
FDLAVKGSPYLRGLVMADGESTLGYVLLSFTYSNEVGGMVVWIEELYVKEAYRNSGLGKQALGWIIKEYKETTKRFRLEVTEENEGAKKLYRSFGFDILPYEQMTLEQ